MDQYRIFPISDSAITFSLSEKISLGHHKKIMEMKDWVEQHAFSGLLDIVIAYSSITILYDAFVIKNTNHTSPSKFVQQHLTEAFKNATEINQTEKKIKKIPVCYEDVFALDIHYVSSTKNLAVEKIVELHTSKLYPVYMIGFLPGFPYMAEIDEQLITPRKDKPRTHIEPGSVGIAGVQTGIYPIASPGGWQIIGRTPLKMFDKTNNPPVMLEPGNTVQFYSITEKEFKEISSSLA